jgi:hypothetical protein
MATWTTLPDASLEPGKPIRSIDGLALRDNPVAITEGATGAPRVQDAALNATVTTAGKDWVSNRIAAQNHQDVGSMTIAWNTTTSGVASNGTIAGSSLRFTSASVDQINRGPAIIFDLVLNSSTAFPTANTTALTGTWKNMGGFCRGRLAASDPESGTTYYWFPSLWLRIA